VSLKLSRDLCKVLVFSTNSLSIYYASLALGIFVYLHLANLVFGLISRSNFSSWRVYLLPSPIRTLLPSFLKGEWGL